MSPKAGAAEPTADAPVTYTGRQGIDVSAVERELGELWRQAAEAAAAAGQEAVTRACLWNLVVYHPPSAESALLDAVCTAVPSRLIRLEPHEASRQPADGRDVTASVATRCNLSPSGGHQICAEEVQIEGYGDTGPAHFPALVRALLVPDLPVALIWLGGPPRKGRLLRDLMRLSDRIVIDTQPGGDREALSRVNELVRDTHALFVDLGWMRLTPVRYLFAGLFDPPGRAEHLQNVDAIRVEATETGRNSAMLMLGWLLSRLGQPAVRAADTPGSAGDGRWTVELNGRRCAVEFHLGSGEAGLDGLLCLDIEADGAHFELRQLDAEHVALQSPEHHGRKVALHGWDDPELVVAGLGGPGRDPLYAAALETAANLIDAEAWNR